ncbi:MAG TPA: response regulator [Candidatus Methylacidiphilales bacterium]|nr:response regulator [Candidatus Methylacidiphilales bacterium]
MKDKQRLLVIDDDPSIIQSLRLLFQEDYETCEAATVEEGLRLFAKIHPPVVILDLKLPDRSGIEALREIRKIDPAVAVVILTGYSTRFAAEESLRLGAVDYVNKPFVASDLKKRIAKLALAQALRQPESSDPAMKEKSMIESIMGIRELQNASAAFLHDVGGPLSCLMAGSDLLSQKINESDEITSDELLPVVSMMGDNVRYLRALVEQWRAFSDLHVLLKDKCDVQQAIDLAVDQVMDMMASSGVVFQIEFHREARYIPGNHFALARVLINLLKNAYEAVSPDKGCICLTVTVADKEMQMVVSDNGPGIGPEQMAKLFTPRYTTKAKGHGLGLFISKKIIEAIEGRIVVRAPGRIRGTDFIITLPLV